MSAAEEQAQAVTDEAVDQAAEQAQAVTDEAIDQAADSAKKKPKKEAIEGC